MFQLAALPTANPLPLMIDPAAPIAAEAPGAGVSAVVLGAAFKTMLAAQLDPAAASNGKSLPLPSGKILPPELPQMDMPTQPGQLTLPDAANVTLAPEPLTAPTTLAMKLRLARHNDTQAKPSALALPKSHAGLEQFPDNTNIPSDALPNGTPQNSQPLAITALPLPPELQQKLITAKVEQTQQASAPLPPSPPATTHQPQEDAAIGTAIATVMVAGKKTPRSIAISTVTTMPTATGAAMSALSPISFSPLADAAQKNITAESSVTASPVFQQAYTTAPLDQPTTASSAPTATDAPRDFAALVETLVQSREAANPRPVQVIMPHADFGQVSLRFDTDDTGLSVAMTSPDPAFASAVQAALPAERSAASGDNAAFRQDNADGAPAQSRSGSFGERQGNDPRPRQHNGGDARAQPRAEARSGPSKSDPSNLREDEVFA
jgi:hypothetical protein